MKHAGTQPMDTQRLHLRPFRIEDSASMLENWIADPAVQHEYGEPVYSTFDEVNAQLERWISQYSQPDFYRWAIIETATDACIGQIAFCRVYSDVKTAEIEYCIGQSRWGKGYANEALSAVIAYAFENTGFTKLEAYHRAENRKSGRVLEKSSMHQVDTVRRFVLTGESPAGEVCYCIEK
ncbi:MAG: GNAT family N-acetyltransferase [Clostridiales bacterium]|nr:GNAT family N-acetyltransferase [Clostridiales bacterium]